jgi:zinc protease
VKDFYREEFTQAKLNLGISGDLPKSIKQQMMTDLTQLPEGEESRLEIQDAPKLVGKSATIVEKATQSTAVSFGFPIDTIRSDKDWAALWLVRSYLGEHRNSDAHLFKRIRQVRGMNYGDYAYIEYFPSGMFLTKPSANLGRSEQIFQIWIRPLRSNNDAHFATRVALYELDKLINEGLTQEDFEASRSFLLNYIPQLVASQSKQLGYAMDSAFYGTENFAQYVTKALKALTLEDVNRAIKNNLQSDNMHYVFITNDAKEMKQRLADDQVSPLKYNSDKPQALLAEDKIIEGYKLNLDADKIKVVPVDQVFQ